MRELEQENEWHVPELAIPRAWERTRGLLWRQARLLASAAHWVAKSTVWVALAALAVLRAPELVRETEPGRPPEREHEWKARRQLGNGGL